MGPLADLTVPALRRPMPHAELHPRLEHGTGYPYKSIVHTVIETPAYLAAAKEGGMGDVERQAVVDLIAVNPEAGDIMPGCGRARKLRVARPGGGKSGGYRVISYYAGADVPVFLLTVFAKNMKSNLTKAGQQTFSTAVKLLTDSLGVRHGKARI